MKYLFRENNNEVKVNKILDLYRKLLNETNNRSKCIMLIVPNATSKLNTSVIYYHIVIISYRKFLILKVK